MSLKAILFDLDGTLLPVDQDVFTKQYFKLLAGKMSNYGYEPNKLIESVLAGTTDMVKNNGEESNEKVFWKRFFSIYGNKAEDDMALFNEFYAVDFQKLKDVCGFNDTVKGVIEQLKQTGVRLVVATNPLFPRLATESRIRWAGLEPNDFELVTTYENSCYSKPNPNYFLDISKKLGLNANECLMVGNNVKEDMVAKNIGMKVFLLTDMLENNDNQDISIYPNGNFDDLLKFIEENM